MADDQVPDPTMSPDAAEAWLARELERHLQDTIATTGPLTYEDVCKPNPIVDAACLRVLRENGLVGPRATVTYENRPDGSIRATITEPIDQITVTLNVQE